MKSTGLFFLLLLLLLLWAAPAAMAQSFEELNDAEKEALITHISQGSQAFDRGDFAGACRQYEAAAQIAEFAEVYYRLALCRERLDELGRAIAAYERHLELAPDIADRGRIEAEIERLRRELFRRGVGYLRIASEPAEALVRSADGATLGTTPLNLELVPGSHELHFSAAGRLETTRVVELAPGATVELHVELDPISWLRVLSEPPGAEVRLDDEEGLLLGVTPLTVEIEPGDYRVFVTYEDRPSQVRDITVRRGQSIDLDITMIHEVHSGRLGPAGWSSLGLGATTAVGTAFLWFLTESRIEEANTYSRTNPNHSRQELQQRESQALQLQRYTQIAGLATAGFLGLGATFLIVHARTGTNAEEPQLSLSITDGGPHAVLRFSF